MKITLVVSNGQYERAAEKIQITATTYMGFCRRIDQLKKEHAVYGDNMAGWINADVALADDNDEWGDNDCIGGRWCTPANGWIVDDPEQFSGYPFYCRYQDAWAKIQEAGK
jgi:hypothetical protein